MLEDQLCELKSREQFFHTLCDFQIFKSNLFRFMVTNARRLRMPSILPSIRDDVSSWTVTNSDYNLSLDNFQ